MYFSFDERNATNAYISALMGCLFCTYLYVYIMAFYTSRKSWYWAHNCFSIFLLLVVTVIASSFASSF